MLYEVLCNYSKAGRLYKNIVFVELKRRFSESTSEIYYWKDSNGHEVDFLIKVGLKAKEIIQVCSNIEEEKTKQREVNNLLEALRKFKAKQGIIITDGFEGEDKIKNKKIRYVPIWKWLLQEFIKKDVEWGLYGKK